jgi:hypothetical protein
VVVVVVLVEMVQIALEDSQEIQGERMVDQV